MPSIIDFFTRQKREIDKIVDTTFFRLLETTAAIDPIMPVRDYLNRKILLMKFGNVRPTIASIVAEEQDIPATRPRATLDEQLFSNLKLGKKLLFTARHFELMQEMELYLASGGPMGAQMATEMERFFFGQAADLVPCVIESLTMLTFKVATTGTCIYTDPLTGGRVELTYPDTIPALMPAALTGNNRWSQPATCTPLANLEAHARSYYDNFGVFPSKIVMRWANLRQVADSNEAKVAKLRQMGADGPTPDTTGLYLPDQEAVDLIRQRTRANEVITFDAMYSEENSAGQVTDRYYLDDNTYFFAMDGMFERAFVPTVEKNFQSGIYFVAEEVSKAPRREHAIALGNGIPFCADPRKIAARRVA